MPKRAKYVAGVMAVIFLPNLPKIDKTEKEIVHKIFSNIFIN